jgi:hypothetical protein
MLSFSSGAATSGSSGSIMVGTGEALGGMLNLTVGSGNRGAKVLAGETSAGTGGSLTLHAGLRLEEHQR